MSVRGRHRGIALAALVAVALLLAACGSADDTGGSTTPVTTATGPATTTAEVRVSVFFPRGDPGPSCRRVRPVTRTVAPPRVLTGAIQALLSGPTADERGQGYGGWLGEETAGSLRRVTVRDGVARIDFRDFSRAIPNASSSCGSALLLAQLDRTATQFPTVERAVYSFDGSVAAFYEWLQLSPPPE